MFDGDRLDVQLGHESFYRPPQLRPCGARGRAVDVDAERGAMVMGALTRHEGNLAGQFGRHRYAKAADSQNSARLAFQVTHFAPEI